jgi:hypothetical protein
LVSPPDQNLQTFTAFLRDNSWFNISVLLDWTLQRATEATFSPRACSWLPWRDVAGWCSGCRWAPCFMGQGHWCWGWLRGFPASERASSFQGILEFGRWRLAWRDGKYVV